MEQDQSATRSEPQPLGKASPTMEETLDRSQSAPTMSGQLNPSIPIFTTREEQQTNEPLPSGLNAPPPIEHSDTNFPAIQGASSRKDAEVNPLFDDTIADLRPLQQPLRLPRGAEGSFDPVRLRMTMLQPAYTFLNDPGKPAIRARYDKLVEFGLAALERPKHLPERHLSRNERSFFKEELQALDRLLTEVFQYKFPNGSLGYTIKYSLLEDIQSLLTQTRANVREKISQFTNEELPENPRWGPDDRPHQYWKPNDFEILGVNFRLQTETLLVAMADGIRERNRIKAMERSKGKQRARSIEQNPTSETTMPTENRAPAPPLTNAPPLNSPPNPSRNEEEREAFNEVPPRFSQRSRTQRSTSRETNSRSPRRFQSPPRPTTNPFKNQEIRTDTSYSRTQSRERGREGRDDREPNRMVRPPDAESSVSRYRPRSPIRPVYATYTDPRPSALRPTFIDSTRQPVYPTFPQYPTAPIPSYGPPMMGGIKDNTTSNRLQQLLAPSRDTNDPREYQSQSFPPYPYTNFQPQGMTPASFPYTGGGVPPPPPPPIDNRYQGRASAAVPGGGGGDEPSDSDDDGGRRPDRHRRPRLPRERGRRRGERRERDDVSDSSHATVRSPPEPRFDTKFRLDIIPTWNGNADDLGRWVMKINRLARQSRAMFEQLGALVPTRLEGTAEKWYYSLSADTRNRLETNWDSLRQGICEYFMNQTWLESQKIRANNAKYREMGHGKETPSDYFIRKLELLQLNFNYTDRELITQIMAGFPIHWTPILTPHLYFHVEQLQAAVKFFEETLLKMDIPRNPENPNFHPRFNSRNPFYQYRSPRANTNLVEGGSRAPSNNLPKPQFPKDDSNVSKRGSPESVGKRPCRHCGSGKHWDYECKFARKGERIARVNKVELSTEEYEEQKDYDDTYYAMESEDEDFGEALLSQEP